MKDLFSLPEYAQQDQLLDIAPVRATITSNVANPIARVIVDVPHAHMGSLFDYEVPEKFADVPVGARVMVDLGSQRVQGFIAERVKSTQFHATLRPIARVVSALPVLDEHIYRLAHVIARRQSSTVASSLRLAIPQRHARAEEEFLDSVVAGSSQIAPVDVSNWEPYSGGTQLVEQLGSGNNPRSLVQVRSVDSVLSLAIDLIHATIHSGRSVILCVPTARQAQQFSAAITKRLGLHVATMISENAPDVRYKQFLEVKSGRTKIIVGTRNAAWAPAQKLGLLLLIDDHHKAFIEPHNPYIHTRDLLLERSNVQDCGFVCLNYGPSVELAYQTQNTMSAVLPAHRRDRHGVPQVLTAASLAYEGETWSRMPSAVFTVIRSGLERGDVLVVVPRTGYIPVVACARCREIATCPLCDGRIGLLGPDKDPQCSRCGSVIHDFTCRHCHGHKLKPVRIGSHRTAQEIGRAFRDVPIHIVGTRNELAPSSQDNGIVIATPGQIPHRAKRFAAAVILDAGYLLRSENLDTDVFFLRSLAHICVTVSAQSQGGQVLVVGDIPASLTLVLKHWDMYGWSCKALAERQELGLPPHYVWRKISGSMNSLRHYLAVLQSLVRQANLKTVNNSTVSLLSAGVSELIPGMRVIGPLHHGEHNDQDHHMFLSFPQSQRTEITDLISRAQHIFSVQRMGKLTITMDTTI
ncbi:hypothetical protein [Arcanobacterium pinnipediorum]|uniref:Primosomal protein N' 3' DNA-binding domain-containing protein n=1 Tax=Arcanobacterium pinnipediorum TaxID=1503041 RepID=A0ABY5AJQ8_9ACTO|nr:hypothetical protein [Arcanobacterium pinnipediorum]USR80196.1 hypothetical protein NG665_04285 [Arcanobacterium pinnipediorum]